MKQGEVTIFPATVRIPCDIWGCRSGQMASHFLGRPENPKNVLTNLCPTCLEQLTKNVMEQFGNAAEAEEEPESIVSQINHSDDSITIQAEEIVVNEEPEIDTVNVLEIDGKLITDFTVRELKELAQEEKISGYSDKNKEELIDLITAHFEKSEE